MPHGPIDFQTDDLRRLRQAGQQPFKKLPAIFCIDGNVVTSPPSGGG